jgi:hypothetical protein
VSITYLKALEKQALLLDWQVFFGRPWMFFAVKQRQQSHCLPVVAVVGRLEISCIFKLGTA